jgi:starch synthase
MSAVVPFYVKTAYHDEPSFANTKVITSLFAKNLKKDLGQDFKKCLEFRDAKAELLASYSDTFDFEELGKLAIDYSDGIVQAEENVSKTLLKHIAKKNIPLLGYQEELGIACETFYDQVYPDVEENG